MYGLISLLLVGVLTTTFAVGRTCYECSEMKMNGKTTMWDDKELCFSPKFHKEMSPTTECGNSYCYITYGEEIIIEEKKVKEIDTTNKGIDETKESSNDTKEISNESNVIYAAKVINKSIEFIDKTNEIIDEIVELSDEDMMECDENEDINETIEKIDETTEKIDETIKKVDKAAKEIDETIKNISKTNTELKPIQENNPTVDEMNKTKPNAPIYKAKKGMLFFSRGCLPYHTPYYYGCQPDNITIDGVDGQFSVRVCACVTDLCNNDNLLQSKSSHIPLSIMVWYIWAITSPVFVSAIMIIMNLMPFVSTYFDEYFN